MIPVNGLPTVLPVSSFVHKFENVLFRAKYRFDLKMQKWCRIYGEQPQNEHPIGVIGKYLLDKMVTFMWNAYYFKRDRQTDRETIGQTPDEVSRSFIREQNRHK